MAKPTLPMEDEDWEQILALEYQNPTHKDILVALRQNNNELTQVAAGELFGDTFKDGQSALMNTFWKKSGLDVRMGWYTNTGGERCIRVHKKYLADHE